MHTAGIPISVSRLQDVWGTKPTENSAHGSTVYQRKWGREGGGGTGPAERFPSMAPSQVNVRAWGGGGML
jgi:hypothetical protein